LRAGRLGIGQIYTFIVDRAAATVANVEVKAEHRQQRSSVT